MSVNFNEGQNGFISLGEPVLILDQNVLCSSIVRTANTIATPVIVAKKKNKKVKKPFCVETIPSRREALKCRLLKKLSATVDELAIRGGLQAVVLVTKPGKQNPTCKIFGTQPLQSVIYNLKDIIMEELKYSTTEYDEVTQEKSTNSVLFELPSIVFNGEQTTIEKMTQAQLRTLIPLMLKYSTGREKIGWGRECTRPPWWPSDIPWANVRLDTRTGEDKQNKSWTDALRKIVINCYKYHGREDLLMKAGETIELESATINVTSSSSDDQITSAETSTVSLSNRSRSMVVADQYSSRGNLKNGAIGEIQIKLAKDDNVPAYHIQLIDGQVEENVDFDAVTVANMNAEMEHKETGSVLLQVAQSDHFKMLSADEVQVRLEQHENNSVHEIELMTREQNHQYGNFKAVTEAVVDSEGQVFIIGQDANIASLTVPEQEFVHIPTFHHYTYS